MSGNKTETISPMSMNNIHKVFEVGMMGRAKPFKKGFDQARRNLVTQHDGKNKKKKYQSCLLFLCFIEKKKSNENIKREPDSGPAYNPHHVVQKNRITAIQQKK